MSANDRLTRSLPHLQNLIKRDSDAYREDFKLQYLHFESQFMELTAKPDTWNKSLAENISFVSQVAHCYPEECKGLSQILNTIREICSRCYLAMDEDLLHDLSKYKSYRDKSVSASARSLIQLFREKNPQLLERKDRGKPTEFQRDLIPLEYGQTNPKSYLDGAEILQQDLNDQDKQSNDEQDQQEDQLSEKEEWIDVSHSDDEEDDNNNNDDDDQNEQSDDQQQDHNQENTNKMEKEMTEEERRGRAITMSTPRILTQRDFEQLKIVEMKKRIQDRRKNRLEQSITNNRKRKTISIDTDSNSDDENKKNSEQ
ncbi:unnamed protein product, partial [Rotaria sp. Silwood2]